MPDGRTLVQVIPLTDQLKVIVGQSLALDQREVERHLKALHRGLAPFEVRTFARRAELALDVVGEDALFKNPSDELLDEIEVTDPTHPLFGRRFSVLSISHPPHRPGHVLVAYRDFMRLRIPVQATGLAAGTVPRLRTQFTRAALLDLLALLKECEAPCSAHPAPSGADSPKP
jgi:hypothetical protein